MTDQSASSSETILAELNKFRELVRTSTTRFENLNRIERMALTLVAFDAELHYACATLDGKNKDINIIELIKKEDTIEFGQRELELFMKISGQNNLVLETLEEDAELASFSEQLTNFKKGLTFATYEGIDRVNNIVISLVCEHVKELPKYKSFLLEPELLGDISKTNKCPIAKELLKQENSNGKYTSLDLKSANYYVMHRYGIFEEPVWNEFIQKFIRSSLFSSNKFIRVLIIGKLTHKWSEYVYVEMQKIREMCFQQYPEADYVGTENDEILFRGFVDFVLPDHIRISKFTIKHFEIPDASTKKKKALCFIKFENGEKKIKHWTGNRHNILKFAKTAEL